MTPFQPYPLKFHPILKERIWGGQKLNTILGKELTSAMTGESWELSTVGEDISIISNGIYAEQLLTEILNSFPEEILGTKVYNKFGNQFPLLFKFIDAKADLSIQVHPSDELAKKRHNSFGKTEMWYIMHADEHSRIIVGFKEKSSPDEYLYHLSNKTLVSILDEEEVKKGDVFMLETGTIHAIGAGILLAEIQQTSDITYRVYDWDRVDAEGKPRELHIDLALEAINYDVIDARRQYASSENRSVEVVKCPYFTTAVFEITGRVEIEKDVQSFTVYMCVEGDLVLHYGESTFPFKKGDTILIPAVLSKFSLTGQASLLEIYIS